MINEIIQDFEGSSVRKHQHSGLESSEGRPYNPQLFADAADCCV